MATEKSQASRPDDSGTPPAPLGAPDVPSPSDGPTPPPADQQPEVLAERGKYVVRLDDWTTTEFRCQLGEGDDAKQVVVTTAGLQVTKAQAAEIREAAARHAVAVTIEGVDD